MKKETEKTIVSSEMTSKAISETVLLKITGGATEELFGSYH